MLRPLQLGKAIAGRRTAGCLQGRCSDDLEVALWLGEMLRVGSHAAAARQAMAGRISRVLVIRMPKACSAVSALCGG